jgi:predicted TIM-barrel fold metal-dependent hydrolase
VSDLLPDPQPRPVIHTIISADDHLVEPPDVFESRVEQRFRERAPRVVRDDAGLQVWEFDGVQYKYVGTDAAAGRDRRGVKYEPCDFDAMRPGCWKIEERIRDMDINGIWASLNFPSTVTGFCGSLFANAADPELGMACTRAWNDWHFETLYSPYPERIIPQGITWLSDPEIGAKEIRRNASRGFRAVSLPERPQRLGLPNVYSGHWDPIIEACAETGTVVNLHVGSSGHQDLPEGCPSLPLAATLFGQLSLTACAEWLWSGYPARFPELRFAMSEGGIGWVAMLIDRLNDMTTRSHYASEWPARDVSPAEALRRNFSFCTIDDVSTLCTRDTIGIENIMVESDYPHGDSTWPDTQEVVAKLCAPLTPEETRRITHLNAAELYRHPLPPKGTPG